MDHAPNRKKDHRARAASRRQRVFARCERREGEEEREWERRLGGDRDRVVKMMATDSVEIRNQTSPCPIPDNSLSTLSIKITRKNQDRHWKLRFIYLQCCEYRHTPRRLESNTEHRLHKSAQKIMENVPHPCFRRRLVCRSRINLSYKHIWRAEPPFMLQRGWRRRINAPKDRHGEDAVSTRKIKK